MNKLAKFTILLCLFLSSNSVNILAADPSPDSETKGSFILRELLIAHQTIAHSVSSHIVNRQIPGSIVSMHEKKYEIVSFIFEDPTDKLAEEAFEEYAKRNNLFGMKSSLVSPVEGLMYEVFDSRKSHTDDGVYFYIVLRPLIPFPIFK